MSNPAETMTSVELSLPSGPGDDDRSLVARAAAGERQAARTLYDRHSPRVHRLAYRMCGDQDLAADLTQDVFVQVFRQLAQFRGESAFSTWLHRVAVTTVLNAMRRVKRLRTREAELDEAKDHAVADDGLDPELREALAKAIEALPEGLRIALVMHAIEGYTHVEIGEALGIAEGTSKKRVFDARGLLRHALANHR